MKDNKRKVYLINRQFQIRFILFSILSSVIICCIFFALNWYFFWRFETVGLAIGLTPGSVFFEFLSRQQVFLNTIFFVGAGVTLLVLVFMGLIFSHRIAGPLYRLNNHMSDVAKGETNSNISFRKKDYFPELADSLNLLLDKYRKDVKDNRGVVSSDSESMAS